jgi:hypothetical protein
MRLNLRIFAEKNQDRSIIPLTGLEDVDVTRFFIFIFFVPVRLIDKKSAVDPPR